MTWNVRGAARPDLAALAAAIQRFEPDVVALQEIRPGQARRLARHLGHHHRWARKHFPYGVFMWWRAEGLAILSPHHLDSRHRYVLSPGVHSWTYRRRIALRVRVRLPAVSLRVFNAHLASHGAAGERIDQATILAGHIAAERQRVDEEGGEPFVALVLGDLNAHDEPDVLAPLAAARFRDAWVAAEARSVEPGWTCTTEDPSQRIDYVLLSEDHECDEVQVPETGPDWVRLSDHLPVVAHIRLG